MHPYEERFTILYDLVITSKEAIMPMDAAIVHPTGVYCFCTLDKVDARKGESYLNGMFTAHRLDPHVKIIKDEKTFFQRLDSLKPASEYEDDGKRGVRRRTFEKSVYVGEDGSMKTVTITKNEAGQRMDKMLAKYLNLAPKSFIYKMIRKKNITLNGKRCDGSEKLAEGDEISLFFLTRRSGNFPR